MKKKLPNITMNCKMEDYIPSMKNVEFSEPRVSQKEMRIKATACQWAIESFMMGQSKDVSFDLMIKVLSYHKNKK